MRHPFPLKQPLWWFLALTISCGLALALYWFGPWTLDRQQYDFSLAHNVRPLYRHTARVAPDNRLPLSMSRQQMLPLYALAIERLQQLGAKSAFLDAKIALRNYRTLDFAQCVRRDGSLQGCSLRGAPFCSSDNGRPRQAPLDLHDEAMSKLVLPEPLSDRSPAPYDFLFGFAHIEANSLPQLASPELPDSPDGVVRQVYADQNSFLKLLNGQAKPLERCSGAAKRPCLAVRFGQSAQWQSGAFPTIPLSQLASCNAEDWQVYQPALRGRSVVIQLTPLDEATDLHLTPLRSESGFGNQLTHGSQLIQDALETSFSGDGPLKPSPQQAIPPLLATCILTVLLFALLEFWYALGFSLLLASGMWLLSPLLYPLAGWPMLAGYSGMLSAAALVTAGHLRINTRRSRLLRRFLPAQVHKLLLSNQAQALTNCEVQATILMSDLAGYTTLSSLLGSPKRLFALLNSYLDAISSGMQQQHDAWLEAYVGDMVCYYWPVLDMSSTPDIEAARRRAIQAARDLQTKQASFFAHLPQQLQGLTPEQMAQIQRSLYAGIALTEGWVMLGEVGPQEGVRKFGILGDPLNLCARLESLTRKFDARLLVTEEFCQAAQAEGMLPRRLGRYRVKGRPEAVQIYSLEHAGKQEAVDGWHSWLAAFEQSDKVDELAPCPAYTADASQLLTWRKAGLWLAAEQLFQLDEK